MVVKIIAGAYRYKANGAFKVKTKEDEPFELPDKEAQRLIGLKVAEAIGAADVPEYENVPAYSEDMPLKELRSVAEKHGIKLPAVGVSKADVIKALDAVFGKSDEDGDDDVLSSDAEEPV